jgi:precorrin-3B synthase
MTAHAINRLQRRGACPGLSAPMATGDGLLVRLTPIGTIALDAFDALCAAAQRHGNGIVEITARGNIQVRGLSAASAPQFAATVAALDIAAVDGVPIVCNPLAGLDPEDIIDAGALAADLRLALGHASLAAKLSPKVSVAIDGGGQLTLDGIAADLRLCAVMIDGMAMLRVGVGGNEADATPLGLVAPGKGVETATRLLGVLAQRGHDARARDLLAADAAAPFVAAVTQQTISARPRESGDPVLDSRLHGNERKDPVGLYRLRHHTFAFGAGLAFGHADATMLQRFTGAARAAGATGLRAAPDRTLMTIGLTQQTLPAFTAAAENLGFIVRADDPRRNVVACAGAPVCASAEIAARALAPVIATIAAPYLDGTFKIHISGCAKGCAHPAAAALTVVGTAAGCALVAGGTARDAPFKIVAPNELPAAIAEFARGQHGGGHV